MSAPTVFLAGASRGLGLAMAEEFAKKGWRVVGTVRGEKRTPLHDLADRTGGAVEIEHLDINDYEELASLRRRLDGRTLDILFVNAGMTKSADKPIGEVSKEDFVEVMITNALSPMHVLESLQDLVANDGVIGAMSSGQGSITNNSGLREVYRGSKAALNMYMKCFALRQAHTKRAFVLMAPGWVKTELGGPDARLTIEESVPNLVNVLLAQRATPGIAYLDYLGRAIPW